MKNLSINCSKDTFEFLFLGHVTFTDPATWNVRVRLKLNEYQRRKSI